MDNETARPTVLGLPELIDRYELAEAPCAEHTNILTTRRKLEKKRGIAYCFFFIIMLHYRYYI